MRGVWHRASNVRCEVFLVRDTLERTALPPTILTDYLGMVQGLDRGRLENNISGAQED